MRAVVIGGGIGGLAAAIGLHRAGVEVEVLERRAGPSAEGSGLSLFGNGFTALDAIGAGDAVRAICAPHPPPGPVGIRRPDGSWLSRTDPVAFEQLRIVHRAELLAALQGCLPDGAMRGACEVTEVREEAGRPSICNSHAEVLEADLVVAADGIDSRVRRSWPVDPGIECVGYGAWRGITGSPVDLGDSSGGGETWGRGLRFGHAPLRDGRVYWFAVATSPSGAFEEPPPTDTLRVFERWHDPIGPIMRATPPSAVFWLPIRALRGVAPSFVRGHVVLLGDAAHAMTPNRGQGANQALEDAATLTALVAQVIDGHTTLVDALARYDSLRRPRTAMVSSRAHRIGALAHPRLPWPTSWRDLLLQAVPESLVTRQAVALQAWSPPTRGV